MSRPYALFRYRRRPLQRIGEEVVGGGVLAGIVLGILRLIAKEEFWAVGPATALAAIIAYHIFTTFRKRRRWVALFDNRIVWQDDRGRKHEVLPSSILEVEPDQHGRNYSVRLQGGQGFTLSPDLERFSELRLRLQNSGDLRSRLPLGRGPWEGATTYGPQGSAGVYGLVLFVIGAFLGSFSYGRADLFFGLISLLPLSLGIYQTLSSFCEGIDIEDDEIVHRSWIPGIERRIPLGSIVGSCVLESRIRRVGVIDTDSGEISFGMDFEGAEEIINEAERLGIARFEQARRLAGPRQGAEALSEQSLTT